MSVRGGAGKDGHSGACDFPTGVRTKKGKAAVVLVGVGTLCVSS